MDILGQTPVQSILFFILYGVTGAVPLVAALYLLLRPCNVFSAEITPPAPRVARAGGYAAVRGTCGNANGTSQ